MSEFGTFYGGLTGKSKDDFTNGNCRYITYMNVFSNLAVKLDMETFVNVQESEKQHSIAYGDIIFTGSSETRDEAGMSSVVTYKPNEKIYLNSFCFALRPNNVNLLNPEFAKHLFRGQMMREQIISTSNGVTRFNISKKMMADVLIPILPYEEQTKIANILDAFESLTTSLQSGLPAEIALRRQQYEYYRNKLLTFKRAS